MHSLLTRQIKRCKAAGDWPEPIRQLIASVDEAYQGFDADRIMLERSMDVCSIELTGRNREAEEAQNELLATNAKLSRLTSELEVRVAERTNELEHANAQLHNDIAERNRAEEALRVAEEKYRLMFESATDGIFQTTVEGRFLACNPALARIYGFDSPEQMKSCITDLARQVYVDQDTRARFLRETQATGTISGFEFRALRKDKSIIWVSVAARTVRDTDGNLLYFEGFLSDITARKQAEEALRESQESYALAVRGANDGLWDWNLREGQIHFSTRWKEMLGAGPDDIGTLPEDWFKRVHPDDLDSLKAAIAAHREGLTPHFEIEHRIRHADGTYRWMLTRGMAIRDAAQSATRMAGSQTDVTARKVAEEQLLKDALRDGLSGLPNRVLFTDRLERSIARMARDPNHRFATLFLDIDRFKVINDSLGHNVGDQLLIAFARRVSSCLRSCDTVARLGGDEFTILLEDPQEPDDANTVANRILDVLKKPFVIDSHEVFVSTSIGIALSSPDYTRPQDVLRDADTAMYRAKAKGKSCYQIFDAGMHARAVQVLQIENDLRRAIDRNEFELHYQPIMKIGSDRIKSFEALIRWRHPERGLIAPSEFIPMAEETGLIIPIGRWVLHEACRQTARWHAQFPTLRPDINVNLSGKQFSQADLVEQVIGALHETGLPPEHLTLEITESVVMGDPESAILMLLRLRDLGVKLNIDDFGTGYSSLAYLQRFPVDTMKIDRSFVSRMHEAPENAEIIRTIVALAHALNIQVTAEGIETAEQLAQLQILKCENAQGYFLSRPVPSQAATQLMANAAAGKRVA